LRNLAEAKITQENPRNPPLKLYGLKNCDTCRKAIKELTISGNAVHVVDVRVDRLSSALISSFIARFGADLVNRKSTTWRNLSAAERLRPATDLLADYPALMKRPIIETKDGVYLGWPNAALARIL
jgi:arsenate reductase